MEPTEKKLVKKLSEIMQEVKYIEKRGKNKFHNYKYVTEADVNEKVREFLAARFIMMVPSMKNHEVREHTNRSGNVEYIVTVDMTFTFMDGETGEELTLTMSGSGQDAGDKGIMKAISAAQKYALMKLFMIPTGDDPEADTGVDERNSIPSSNQQQNQTLSNVASEKQIGLVNKLIKEVSQVMNITEAAAVGTLKQRMNSAKDINQYTKSEASKAIEILNKAKEVVA